MRAGWFLLLAVFGLTGCRVLTGGIPSSGAPPFDAQTNESQSTLDLGEPQGVPGPGCADGTREGFRAPGTWPDIAGCAGGFDQPGVVGPRPLLPTCQYKAGDTGDNPTGRGCSAADLCAPEWHVCRDGSDVKRNSGNDCENCVPWGEPRFFLVAIGAGVSNASDASTSAGDLDASEAPMPSSMGICVHDLNATNDLHGCGGMGQSESPSCAPLLRRMGFADCAATSGVWQCGEKTDHLREASVVVKTGPTMGGVLCCRN